MLREDNVENDGGAEVDGADDDAEEEGDYDCVEGDGEVWGASAMGSRFWCYQQGWGGGYFESVDTVVMVTMRRDRAERGDRLIAYEPLIGRAKMASLHRGQRTKSAKTLSQFRHSPHLLLQLL